MTEDTGIQLGCVAIRLSIVCRSCNSLIAVNGAQKKVTCDRCGSGTNLQGDFGWHRLLDFGNPGIDVFRWAVQCTNKKSETGAIASIRLEAFRRWPQCASCGRRFGDDAVIAAACNGRDPVCGKCGAATPVVPAPKEMTKPFRCAMYVIGGADPGIIKGKTAAARGGGNAPKVLYCAACGAPLGDFEGGRSVACSSCATNNFMPDTLNAHEKARFWYILFDQKLIRAG